MKKKLLRILLAIVSAVCLAFGSAACGSISVGGGNGGNNSNKPSGGNGGNSQTEQGGNEDKPDTPDTPNTPVHSHNYNQQSTQEKYLKSAATCTDKAVYYYSCECGEMGTQTFEYGTAKGHVEEVVKGYDSTCTAKGLTDGKKCSVCQTVLKAQTEIAVKEHTASDWIEDEASTCTEEGSRHKECTVCHTELETGAIGKLAHTPVTDYTVAATCTSTGLTEGSHCSLCGEVLVEQKVIPVGEHDYTESITAKADCTKKGVKKYTCSFCGDTYSEEYSLTQYDAETVYEMVKDSVVEITTYDKSGSAYAIGTGFVYSSDGKIITNYHVIDKAYSAKVSFGNKEYSVSSVLAYDKDIDIAILKISASSLTPLIVCTKPVAVGSVVYAIGSSKGLTSTFSNGIVSAADRVIDGVKYIQHNAAISSGNSGGPLINVYGEVIGINTWTVKDSQNLNFAIFTTEIANVKTLSSSMTLKEVYEKEYGAPVVTDTFTKLVNIAKSNGKYDSSKNKYSYLFKMKTTSSYVYGYYIDYDVSKRELSLSLLTSGNLGALFDITLSAITGYYSYSYLIVDYYYFVTGHIDGSTFSSSTKYLTYSSINVSNSSVALSVLELASSSAKLYLEMFNTCFASQGLSARSLGFVNF